MALQTQINPWRGIGLTTREGMEPGEIITSPNAALQLFSACPAAQPTPLLEPDALAAELGISKLHIKDERTRMGLGNFKALGAAHAIAKMAHNRLGENLKDQAGTALSGVTFVCASAGNHGLSMAAGARLFGAQAVVFLSETVPETFADALRAKGALVARAGQDYEASMAAAQQAATKNGWQLLSDSSWPGYHEPAVDVMEGYLIMGAEVADQLNQPPSHVFIQAGVGGLAASVTAMARRAWGDGVTLCVVEPDAAPALFDSIKAGRPVTTTGPVSNMGRLDCKEPSHLALSYLARQADVFATLGDNDATRAAERLNAHGIDTTPTGAAGLAALIGANRTQLGIDSTSRVLVYVTEGSLGGG